MQAFTFYASDDKLKNRGNKAEDKYSVSLLIIAHLHHTQKYCSHRQGKRVDHAKSATLKINLHLNPSLFTLLLKIPSTTALICVNMY